MKNVHDPIDRRLLDDWQRNFPICPRPFQIIAKDLDISEDDVLSRLTRMNQSGRITRVGGTCAPNTLSASTLAAVAAPEVDLEKVAQIINDEPGVNHSYEREDHWNLWFVATGPDRAHVDATLARISERSGLRVLDLRLVRPFNVDLGFRMSGVSNPISSSEQTPLELDSIQAGDHEIMNALTQGLPIVPTPYAEVARDLGLSEDDVLSRITALQKARVLSRLGVIVRHRALGWTSNAMVVWNVSASRVVEAGTALASLPGVTLCYERTPVDDVWPYRLYSMIHAKSRPDAMAVLERAKALEPLVGCEHKALFSTRCFRQNGAMITRRKGAVA
ncbi:siroheme decarboxylase subunit beta [Aliiroseovarius marinus]|uniref:siroheme decarboxylase subunit beta n=1 Tax=Aliiroseovarius marinus TaxID=2500159 RepID=UPI003D7CC572